MDNYVIQTLPLFVFETLRLKLKTGPAQQICLPLPERRQKLGKKQGSLELLGFHEDPQGLQTPNGQDSIPDVQASPTSFTMTC